MSLMDTLSELWNGAEKALNILKSADDLAGQLSPEDPDAPSPDDIDDSDANDREDSQP